MENTKSTLSKAIYLSIAVFMLFIFLLIEGFNYYQGEKGGAQLKQPSDSNDKRKETVSIIFSGTVLESIGAGPNKPLNFASIKFYDENCESLTKESFKTQSIGGKDGLFIVADGELSTSWPSTAGAVVASKDDHASEAYLVENLGDWMGSNNPVTFTLGQPKLAGTTTIDVTLLTAHADYKIDLYPVYGKTISDIPATISGGGRASYVQDIGISSAAAIVVKDKDGNYLRVAKFSLPSFNQGGKIHAVLTIPEQLKKTNK